MRLKLLALLTLFLLPASAQAADQAAATACSATLSKDGQLIYAKVAPTVTPKTDLKEAITAAARPLGMNGTMSRDAARHGGEAAGDCLKHLK